MTSEDAEVMRMVRRELARRPIETGQMDIQVKAGNITLTGRVMNLRDEKGVNLRSEIDIVIKSVTRDRLVKNVFDQLHYVVDHSEGEEKGKNTRGRIRS